MTRACVLVVLDGWGLAPDGPGNAVSLADTPVFDDLWSKYPHTQLTASGEAVGLPDGQMGNSEVGHLNLGAGQVVHQDLKRIDDAIEDGAFAENTVLRDACAAARESGGRLHLLGLVSEGGVHASMDHLKALLELASDLEVPDVIVHAFTDGRDTGPKSGAGYLATVQGWLDETGGRIADVTGRYFAMDRDHREERIQKAFDVLVGTAKHHADTAEQAAKDAYERGETDEFIEPTLVGDEGTIRAGDACVFFNFRPDRARELTEKLNEELDLGFYATLTEYREEWEYPIAFPPARPEVTMASTLADRGVKQLHVAETEKYAHVTYFFNGGEESEYTGEDRFLVDSPRDVPTYDHKPEMSARAAADTFVEHWDETDYGFGVINFANPDMVGHTGVIEAAVKAIETVDGCLADVVEAVTAKGGVCMVTADHGNADNMLEPDGSPNTAHSLNPVPFVVTDSDAGALRDGGILADVMPTALQLMGEEQPPEMTGRSLLDR